MSKEPVWIAILMVLCFCKAKTLESELRNKYPVPSIVQEKTLYHVLEGADIVLPCRTTCDCIEKSNITTAWLVDGHRVYIANAVVLPSGDLQVSNATSDVVGGKNFQCVAGIKQWSVIGLNKRIRVIKRASVKLSTLPAKTETVVGSTVSLQCSYLDASELSISQATWHKDGKVIQIGTQNKYRTLPGGYLLIQALSSADAGAYQCSVYSSLLGQRIISSNASIKIGINNVQLKTPHFTFRPPNAKVIEGSSHSIHCTAIGNPLPKVTVFFDDSVTLRQEVASGTGFAAYTITNASIFNAGKYICEVTSAGLQLVHEATLDVLSPPKFTSVSRKRILNLKSVTLPMSCIAIGQPMPKITWYKDGKQLGQSLTEKLKIDANGKLTIESMTTKDVGIYQCFASNEVGTIQQSTFVFLESNVRPPINVKGIPLSSSMVKITWQANPLNNENAILTHIVSYEDSRSTSSTRLKNKVLDKISVTELTIDGLYGGTVYFIYLTTYGKNSVRSGQSETVHVKTLESRPDIAPHPLKLFNLGSRSMRVTWNPIPRKQANGEIVSYKIQYGIVGFGNKMVTVPAGKNQADIHNLDIGELYAVEVSAATRVGYGPAEKGTIKIGYPEIAGQKGPPLELEADKSSINVKWSLGKTNQITGLRLSYIPVHSAHYWHDIRTVALQPTTRSYVIENIDPSKMYRIELRILSGPVISKPSVAVFSAEKRAAIPDDLAILKVSNPRDLQCAIKDNTTIFLSWTLPVHHDDIFDYTVHVEHGRLNMEKFKIPHTKDLTYLLKNVSRGTWYYARVKANPKQYRISEVRRQLKRALTVPEYNSKVVACKTAEAKPDAPTRVLCNVSDNGHHAKITWYPPELPRGLITKYIMRYRERSLRLTSEWTEETMELRPSTAGFPYSFKLNGDYYKRYEVRVSAVNSAGEGMAAKIDTCALRRAKTKPTKSLIVEEGGNKSGLMSDDTKLGIIIGCSVASLFIMTFVIVFIWKNPFRVKSRETENNANKSIQQGACSDDFLYLQRLAGLQNSLSRDLTDCNSRCISGSTSRINNGRNSTDRDKEGQAVTKPLMSECPPVLELTGSSSGPIVCTCTCLLHGRVRGKTINAKEQPEFTSTSTSTRDDANGILSNSDGGNSEDIDSAESADSRTKMLPDGSSYVIRDQVGGTKVHLQKKKETKFHV